MASSADTSPDVLSRRSDRNKQTVPDWMDPQGLHGKIEILQMKHADDSKKLPRNPFIIGKSIELAVGKIESANTEARGERYVLKVRRHDQFEKLLQLTKLIDDTPIKIIPHPIRNFTKCVVRSFDTLEMDETTILKELEPQGVTEVRRVTRFVEGKRKNTPTLILTVAGTVLPNHIYFGLLRVETKRYYPRPMLCFNCFEYGHTKARCTNATSCSNCSQTHDTPSETCTLTPFCKNCKQNHQPSSKSCPVYKMEDSILVIKTDRDCTYEEAKAQYETTNNVGSYASKLQERLETARKESSKDAEIQKLRAEMERIKFALANFEALKAAHEKLKKAYLKRISESDAQSTQPKPNAEKAASSYKKDYPKETPKANNKGSKSKRSLDYSISPPGSPGNKQTIINPNMYDELVLLNKDEIINPDPENPMDMEQDDSNNASIYQ